VRDRVVEGAIRQVLEPIFEREFAEHSYGFRPGHSAQEAVARVEALLDAGYTWIVEVDFKGYFDSIPQAPLLELLKEKVSDRRLLRLLQQMLRAGSWKRGRAGSRASRERRKGQCSALAGQYLSQPAGPPHEPSGVSDDPLCR